MTSHYEEEAEVEQLRRWWRENWIALAAGLVLGLGGIYGWEAWQALRTAQAEAASRAFEDLKGLPLEEQARAGQLWHSLSTEHAGTPYAAQAGLLLASYAAARQEWAAAQAKLEWVREHSDDPGLTKLATLRLARVLWQQDQADAALGLLAIGDEDPFATLYHELRGDILFARGDRDGARGAWEKALELGPAAAGRDSLQRKLDDLGVSAPVQS